MGTNFNYYFSNSFCNICHYIKIEVKSNTFILSSLNSIFQFFVKICNQNAAESLRYVRTFVFCQGKMFFPWQKVEPSVDFPYKFCYQKVKAVSEVLSNLVSCVVSCEWVFLFLLILALPLTEVYSQNQVGYMFIFPFVILRC